MHIHADGFFSEPKLVICKSVCYLPVLLHIAVLSAAFPFCDLIIILVNLECKLLSISLSWVRYFAVVADGGPVYSIALIFPTVLCLRVFM